MTDGKAEDSTEPNIKYTKTTEEMENKTCDGLSNYGFDPWRIVIIPLSVKSLIHWKDYLNYIFKQ